MNHRTRRVLLVAVAALLASAAYAQAAPAQASAQRDGLGTALAIASLVASCVSIGGLLVGVGMLLERIRTLEKGEPLKSLTEKHNEAAKEMREGHREHETRIRDIELGRAKESGALPRARGAE